jgi:hypothetical protein
MKYSFLTFSLLLSLATSAQEAIDPSRLPFIHHKPGISGVNSENHISIKVVFSQGLKVILADSSFKVIQFDVIYDCHSRSILDFDIKRYSGNKVDSEDEYLRKRVWSGDVMDIVNTVIEKNGIRYRMNGFSFLVTN